MAKIIIPSNPREILELTQKIIAKVQSEGDDSPLKPLKLTPLQEEFKKGLDLQAEIEKLEKQIEKLYQQRDKIVETADETNKKARDILKGVYRGNEKALGDYGFEVNA